MLDLVRQILFLCLALVVQTTWIHHISVFNVAPDCVILAITFVALTSGPVQATILAFVSGFMQDTYLPAELGLNALSKSIIAFGIAEIRGRVMADTPRVQVLMIFAALLTHDFIFYAAHSGVSAGQLPYYWLRFGLGRALYTAIVGGIIVYTANLRRRHLDV